MTEADLQSLVDDAVTEGREIGSKAQLPGNSDSDKGGFLFDVSSFANRISGDLVFGVTECNGVAKHVFGVDLLNLDATKLRLENLVRDGIHPRIIPNITIHTVSLANSKNVLIVRVPRKFGVASRSYCRRRFSILFKELRRQVSFRCRRATDCIPGKSGGC